MNILGNALPNASAESITNHSLWQVSRVSPANAVQSRRIVGPFQEVWYLKLNDPSTDRALWLRFTLLVNANGFRRVAETWGIFFQKKNGQEVSKFAIKQTYDISAFSASDRNTAKTCIKIDQCELISETGVGGRTFGTIQSKGKTMKWDLNMSARHSSRFNLVPETLSRLRIVKNYAVTVCEDILFTGAVEVDGQKFEFNQAPGMQGHLAGTKNGHSWVWGHCNAFKNEQGESVDFVFEGLSARAKLVGGVASPQLSSFFFFYQGREYHFNSLWDAVRARSDHTMTEWNFIVEKGDISFRGHAKAAHLDFAGVTYEDTDGSFLYCSNSKLSEMTILVYRAGKLEASFKSDGKSSGTAAFEIVDRQKNPYVPLLL